MYYIDSLKLWKLMFEIYFSKITIIEIFDTLKNPSSIKSFLVLHFLNNKTIKYYIYNKAIY